MKILRYVIFFIIPLMLCMSCLTTKQYKGDISKVGEGNVVIVGCIELKPSLEEHELTFGKHYRNQVFFSVEDNIAEYSDSRFQDSINSIKATLGQDFYIKKVFNNKLYMSRIFITVALSDGYMYLPGVFQIEIPRNCKVAYIGKIRFHRDIYNEITKVEIIDDYENSKLKLEEKFDNQVDMCWARIEYTEEKQ